MKGYKITTTGASEHQLSYTKLVGCNNCLTVWYEPCPEGHISYINSAYYCYDKCDNCLYEKPKIDIMFGNGRPHLNTHQSVEAIKQSFEQAVADIKKNYPEDWGKFVKGKNE